MWVLKLRDISVMSSGTRSYDSPPQLLLKQRMTYIRRTGLGRENSQIDIYRFRQIFISSDKLITSSTLHVCASYLYKCRTFCWESFSLQSLTLLLKELGRKLCVVWHQNSATKSQVVAGVCSLDYVVPRIGGLC